MIFKVKVTVKISSTTENLTSSSHNNMCGGVMRQAFFSMVINVLPWTHCDAREIGTLVVRLGDGHSSHSTHSVRIRIHQSNIPHALRQKDKTEWYLVWVHCHALWLLCLGNAGQNQPVYLVMLGMSDVYLSYRMSSLVSILELGVHL